ncbi:MAG: LacI family DNA-binding transcriptional regulator [Verrucomicrobiota bacterium]
MKKSDLGKVNQRVIAKKAQVTQATVSLALRNSLLISKEIRNKIQTLAKRLGYQVNPVVSELMAHLRHSKESNFKASIAYLYPRYYGPKTQLGGYIEGAISRAHALGYKIDPYCLEKESWGFAKLKKILYSRGIRGVLISPSQDELKMAKLVRPLISSFPIVLVGFHSQIIPVSYVSSDHHSGMMQSLRELEKLGHKRIGFVANPHFDRKREGRSTSAYLGYYQLYSKHSALPILEWDTLDTSLLRKWVQDYRPDAIICGDGQLEEVLKKMGCTPFPTLSTPTWNESQQNSHWSGIDQHPEQMGSSAVELLLQQIHHPDYERSFQARGILVEGHWVPQKK